MRPTGEERAIVCLSVLSSLMQLILPSGELRFLDKTQLILHVEMAKSAKLSRHNKSHVENSSIDFFRNKRYCQSIESMRKIRAMRFTLLTAVN